MESEKTKKKTRNTKRISRSATQKRDYRMNRDYRTNRDYRMKKDYRMKRDYRTNSRQQQLKLLENIGGTIRALAAHDQALTAN